MKSIALFRCIVVAGLSVVGSAWAQNGVWTNVEGGSWAAPGNWLNGAIPNGVDAVANFGTLSLTGNTTVTLDGTQTAGSLIFGDVLGLHNWVVNAGAGGALALSASVNPAAITVSDEMTTIAAPLSGQGLTKDGAGTLTLVEALNFNTGVTNNAGTLILFGSIGTTNNEIASDPLVVNAGVVESAATLSLDVNQNNDGGSTNILGAGTLALISTNSGATNADLYFCPDQYENYYYGACLDTATLDLGSAQRYIFALSGHNAVARYDPWEDARIDANIIGDGGITYIAQNTYGGSSPMECQLVLAGTNSFTGMLEIQRGSIYLFTPYALAQTNKVLLDPTNGNNARLFLYGNPATVENLESSGGGTPLIANGNVNNENYINPATLTVNQTSNTVFTGALLDGQYEYDDGSTPPGSLSILKTGPGNLVLTGANTYTGSTTVDEGLLSVAATSTGGGTYDVADGAALGITGIDGNTVVMSDLAFGVSGALNFTFDARPVSFLAPITTASLEANGQLASVTINIFTNKTGIPTGTYPLIHYTAGFIGGNGQGYGSFVLGSVPSGVTAQLLDNADSNTIDLNVIVGTASPPANGVWIGGFGGSGSWENSGDWQNGNIAQGIGQTANFSEVSLIGNATVTLDGALTIGDLIFGDAGNAHSWTLNTGTGGPLILRVPSGAPNVAVSNQTTTIGVALAGTQGLNQTGSGTLILTQPVGYSGGTTNDSGTLAFMGGVSSFNNQTFVSPLVVNSVVESAATLNLDVNQNNDTGSTNVFGPGTLRLIGTTNGPASPDLFFCPDAVANDYYGAALDTAILDLGASQRYIYALTEHNAVAQYDPYEDARIDANIVGSGGITYIAQNTYGGPYPMECQLVLAGTNSFTGMVEIQRGSIYLFTPYALAETNVLLIDPASTNSGRLFLYGNPAVVKNLQSSGPGQAIIANGNLLNPNTVNPATLTVVETSSTVFGGAILDGQYEYDDSSGVPTGSLSVLKTGPATLTLSGPNGYSGATTVAQGELIVAGPQTNSSAYGVASGAELGIAGLGTNTVLMSDLALTNCVVDFSYSSAGGSVAGVTTTTLETYGGANSITVNVQAGSGDLPVGEYPLIQYASGIGGDGSGFGAFRLGSLPAGMTASLVNNTATSSIDLNVTGAAAPAPQVSSVQIQPDGVVDLYLLGTPGTPFSVLASTNVALQPLSAWQTLGSGTISAALNIFSDRSATNYPVRFYLISTP